MYSGKAFPKEKKLDAMKNFGKVWGVNLEGQ